MLLEVADVVPPESEVVQQVRGAEGMGRVDVRPDSGRAVSSPIMSDRIASRESISCRSCSGSQSGGPGVPGLFAGMRLGPSAQKEQETGRENPPAPPSAGAPAAPPP